MDRLRDISEQRQFQLQLSKWFQTLANMETDKEDTIQMWFSHKETFIKAAEATVEYRKRMSKKEIDFI